MRLVMPAAAMLLLAACRNADDAPQPGDVAKGEARALDEAAQMIEGQRPAPSDAGTNAPARATAAPAPPVAPTSSARPG